MTLNLFISYRSTDSAKVDTLVSRLRSLTLPDGKTARYKVWQDKTDITPGEDWWQAIVNGIVGAQVLVYMVSQAAAVNVNCRAEVAYARKRNRAILPVVLQDEFFYNLQSGKNDIHYWSDIPEQLNDLRAQFLFYEGTDFINQVNKAIDGFAAKGFRDIPADFPPDPRPDVAAAKNTLAIYEQACDAAQHMDLVSAERLFQRLVDWRDPDFGEEALGWMEIVRAYQKIVEFDAREASRFKVPSLWATYRALFPKPYVPFFDPRRLHERYEAPVQPTPSAPPPPQPAPAAPPKVEPKAKTAPPH